MGVYILHANSTSGITLVRGIMHSDEGEHDQKDRHSRVL